MKEVNAPNCGRENELIAFLYGELTQAEAQTFQRHVRDCDSCNAELAALSEVRQSVLDWRNETLGVISTPSTELAVTRVAGQRPSALAVVREFFNIAPLWMKGALVFASVLFCLFAGLAIARLQEKPPVAVNPNPGNAHSDQEFNDRVEQRVKEELKKLETRQPPSQVVAENPAGRVPEHQATNGSSIAVVPKARRPLSRTEREQLAADLRLISANSDADLDLLGDRINQ
jgi:hypothetical protein